jgi:glucan-binding YG repeat protein
MNAFGVTTIGKDTYDFDQNNKMISSQFADGYYFDSTGKAVKNTWKNQNGNWYYFGVDGMNAFGVTIIGKDTYDFDQNNKMISGQFADGYYFDSTGKAVKNTWKSQNGNWYYFGENGLMDESGIYTIEKINYGFDDSGKLLIKRLYNYGGNTYYFDNNGQKYTGWLSLNGNKYYFSDFMLKDQEVTDDNLKNYWVNPKGQMYLNLLFKKDNAWYYATSDGHLALNEWISIGKNKYFFDSSNQMVKGQNYWANYQYYKFDQNGNAIQLSPHKNAWYQDEYGNWYYIESDGQAVHDTWYDIDSRSYYFDSMGRMVTDTETWIDGKYYKFDQNGNVTQLSPQKEGWYYNHNSWYYLDKDGQALNNGWHKVQGEWYCFDMQWEMMSNISIYINGYVYRFDTQGHYYHDGWLEFQGNWYYYDNQGHQITGTWYKINGQLYYFDGDGIKISSEEYVIDDEAYQFDDQGHYIKNSWLSRNGLWYYLDKKGHELRGSWLTINNSKYYFDDSGYMVTGDQEINGRSYTFNGSGVLIN